MADFTLSTSTVARRANVPESRVRNAADRGTLPHTRDSNNRRLFSDEAVRILQKHPASS